MRRSPMVSRQIANDRLDEEMLLALAGESAVAIENARYLETKRVKLGHLMEPLSPRQE